MSVKKENRRNRSVCPLRRETVGVQACVKLKRKPLEAKHVSEEKGNRKSPSVREWGKKTVLVKKRVSNYEENRYGRSVC